MKNCRSFFSVCMVLTLLVVAFCGSQAFALENTNYGVEFANYIMNTWPDPDTFTNNKQWEYTNGFMLYAIEQLYKRTDNPAYINYIKNWADKYVNVDGIYPIRTGYILDVVQPSNLLFDLYKEFGEPKYKFCETSTLNYIKQIPVNAEGGFWHKANPTNPTTNNYPNQMWLDGEYMCMPFLTTYPNRVDVTAEDKSYCYNTVVFQLKLIAAHTWDPNTNLFYHAWDCSKAAAWANPTTGCSPMFWSRSIGWYAMALVDCLYYLPSTWPGRNDVKAILNKLAVGLKTYQDPATGLWWQVTDKANWPGNYLETSSSAMFAYALKRAVNQGYLNYDIYNPVAKKAWAGVISQISHDANGAPVLHGCVPGMGVGADYNFYVSKLPADNVPQGLGALMLAASVMENY